MRERERRRERKWKALLQLGSHSWGRPARERKRESLDLLNKLIDKKGINSKFITYSLRTSVSIRRLPADGLDIFQISWYLDVFNVQITNQSNQILTYLHSQHSQDTVKRENEWEKRRENWKRQTRTLARWVGLSRVGIHNSTQQLLSLHMTQTRFLLKNIYMHTGPTKKYLHHLHKSPDRREATFINSNNSSSSNYTNK